MTYTYSPVEMLRIEGEFEENSIHELLNSTFEVSVLNEKQLQQSGMEIEIPDSQSAYFYDASMYWLMRNTEVPVSFKLYSPQRSWMLRLLKWGKGMPLIHRVEVHNL